MSRPQLIAGSPAAIAWGKRMQKRKLQVRAAGMHTEKKFFGKRGIFAKAGHTQHLKNPRPEPQFTSWAMLVDYLKNEGWKPLGKKGVASFGRTIQGLDQALQLEARAWRVLYRSPLYGVEKVVHSLGTYQQLDRALIAANRQANDYLFPKAPKKNPITLNGNPPKRIRADVEGVMYNKVWEIQAEKTGDKHKGFWYHPFKRNSDVQMLALDTGDILIHSKAGKKLWRPD